MVTRTLMAKLVGAERASSRTKCRAYWEYHREQRQPLAVPMIVFTRLCITVSAHEGQPARSSNPCTKGEHLEF